MTTQRNRNEGLMTYNIGKELKELTKQCKQVNWSMYVKKAIEDRLHIEKELEGIRRKEMTIKLK